MRRGKTKAKKGKNTMTQGVKPLGSEPRTKGGISEAGNQTPVQVNVTGGKGSGKTGGAPTAGGGAAALTTPVPSGEEVVPSVETAGQPYTAENADFGGAEPSKPGVQFEGKKDDRHQIFTPAMPSDADRNADLEGTKGHGGEHLGITPGTELSGQEAVNPNPKGSSGPDTRPGVRTPSGPYGQDTPNPDPVPDPNDPDDDDDDDLDDPIPDQTQPR